MGPAGMHLVRPRRLFRPRRVRRGALLQGARPADGASLAARAAAGRARRVRVRLVLRAPLGRLSRDADARLRADRLVGRVPVGRRHRRQQRPRRRLAVGVAGAEAARTTCSSLACTVAGAGLLVAHAARAVRLWRCARSRDSPLRAEAIGIDVRAPAVARLRARRHGRRASPARSSRSPRERSRPRRSASASRSTAS